MDKRSFRHKKGTPSFLREFRESLEIALLGGVLHSNGHGDGTTMHKSVELIITTEHLFATDYMIETTSGTNVHFRLCRYFDRYAHLNLIIGHTSSSVKNAIVQEEITRKLQSKLSDSPIIEVISAGNACVFSDFTVYL